MSGVRRNSGKLSLNHPCEACPRVGGERTHTFPGPTSPRSRGPTSVLESRGSRIRRSTLLTTLSGSRRAGMRAAVGVNAGEASSTALQSARRGTQSAATNLTETGEATFKTWPVAVSRPFDEAIRKITMLSESWLAANR